MSGTFHTTLSPGPGSARERALWPHAPATDYDRSAARSKRHAFQRKSGQRLAHGLSSLLACSWTHSLQNPDNSSGSRLRSALPVAAVCTLPFGRGNQDLLSRLAGSWPSNGTFLVRSGRPFTPISHPDTANLGATTSKTRVRPKLPRDPRLV